MGECRIGVFGAGVVGLNTSLELQRLLRNARVTVIADKFNEETTSDGAAGLFEPASYFSGPTLKITEDWIRNSYLYYYNLRNEADVGIKEVSGYYLSNTSRQHVKNPLFEKVVPFRDVDEDTLKGISPGNWKYGSYHTTLLIECRYYLPWAKKRFLGNGGTVIKGKLNSFHDVSKFGKFDLVVNCTGLGARDLCNDRSVVPIRGQVFKVHAPWLSDFYYSQDSYIIPGFSAATLGGTKNFASWNTEVDPNDSRGIWERNLKVLPRLATAPIIREWVGLRPYRPIVRVEPEIINGLKVVHNYGHGGYGVTSAPGTSQTAAEMAVDLLRSTTAKY